MPMVCRAVAGGLFSVSFVLKACGDPVQRIWIEVRPKGETSASD